MYKIDITYCRAASDGFMVSEKRSTVAERANHGRGETFTLKKLNFTNDSGSILNT